MSYSGVGRHGLMFLMLITRIHKLLLNARSNSGLLTTEINKLHDPSTIKNGLVTCRSLISHKASQVSQRSVTSVSWWSGHGCGSGVQVNADRLMNSMQGSWARKSVLMLLQITLITWPIMHFLFIVCQSLPYINVDASLPSWSDDKSLTTAHEVKQFRIFQLVNQS